MDNFYRELQEHCREPAEGAYCAMNDTIENVKEFKRVVF